MKGLWLFIIFTLFREDIIEILTAMAERTEIMDAIHTAIRQIVPHETKPCWESGQKDQVKKISNKHTIP